MELQTLSRRELFSICFREKYLLISIFLAVSIAVTVLSFILTPQYAAMASILITSGTEFQPQPEAGKQLGAAPYITKQEIINSEIAILTGNDVIASVINQIGLAKLYPKIAENPPSDMRPIDAAMLRFSKDLKVTAVTMSEVINLTYYNRDRDTAIAALSALIATYRVKHAGAFGERKAEFFAKELGDYNRLVDNISQKIMVLRQQKSLFDVTAQQTQLIQDRSQLIDIVQSLESKSVDAHGRINYYEERLRHLTPLVISGQTQSDAIDVAKGKLLDLQTQMLMLRQRFLSDNKLIRDLEQQIETVQDFIQGKTVGSRNTWMQRDPAYDDANVKMQQAQADASSIDAQIVLEKRHLEGLDGQLKDLVDGARSLEAMQRDHDMLDDMTRTVQTRYEEAKGDEDLGRHNAGSVNVIAQPDASTKAAKPKHLLFALVGCGLGFFSVAFALLYFVAFRSMIVTSESVERLLNLRVLAVVPRNFGTGASSS